MTEVTRQPAFPFAAATIGVTVGAVLASGIAAVVISLSFGEKDLALVTAIACGALTWTFGIIGLGVLALAARRELSIFAGSWMATVAIRMVGCLLGAQLLAQAGLTLGGKPLAAALATTYLSLLVIEVLFVWYYLKQVTALESSTPATDQSPTKEAVV